MKTYECGNSVVQIPDAWAELTESQYLKLIVRLQEYNAGTTSIAECRMLWLADILGIDLKSIPGNAQQAADNLFFMSRGISFFTRIRYPEGKLDSVSAEVRRLADRIPAEDLPYSLEVAYLRRLPFEYYIDAVFCKNLIPYVKVGNKKHIGYTADFSDGVFDTSLTALQYITAMELLSAVGHGDKGKQAVLVAVLYGNDITKKDVFKELSAETLAAIVLNFQAFVTFIFTVTEFAILWKKGSSTGNTTGMITLSGIDMLYDLSTAGYGTPDQVENMPLLKYLRIVKKNLVSSVTMLRDMGKNDGEIAEKTGLSLSVISNIA